MTTLIGLRWDEAAIQNVRSNATLLVSEITIGALLIWEILAHLSRLANSTLTDS